VRFIKTHILYQVNESPAKKNILVVTGETSGDHHGALVVRALKEIDRSVHVYGIGGEELSSAGMDILYHSRNLSVVGILEVFSRAFHILKAFSSIRKEFRRSPPALVLLIDYPDFNLRIAKIAKKHNVPVLYYISPQIWAWRRGRAKKISRIVDRMAVIFPFEAPLYEKVGLDVHFVGHPLLDQEVKLLARPQALKAFDLEEGRPIIGLLPGSRKGEIDRMFPPMLEAAELISRQVPSARFVLALAPGINAGSVENLVMQKKVPVKVVSNSFYQVLDICDLALVVSGTATLETALMGSPMVIIYKVSPLTYLIGRLLIRVDCIGLANIVAGKKVVPELIQGEVTPQKIAEEALNILNDPQRMETMKTELSFIKKALGEKGASQRVARMAYEMIHNA
jgi:lipid-A-disaccharide synthase